MKAMALRRAWEIRREASQMWQTPLMAIDWSACLRQAWDEVRTLVIILPEEIEVMEETRILMWAALSQGNIPRAIQLAAENVTLGEELASELVDLANRKLFSLCGLSVDLRIPETRTSGIHGQLKALKRKA